MDVTQEIYKRDVQKRDTKETYKRLQKRPTKEYSMDMTHQKRDWGVYGNKQGLVCIA